MVVSVVFALLFVGGACAYAFGGHALVRALHPEHETPKSLALRLERADDLASATLALTASVYALGALVYAWSRTGKGWRRALAGGLVYYVALELCAAPFLAAALGFESFLAVRDPDHWPDADEHYYVAQGGLNSDFVRCARDASEFRDEDLNVVFLGDSFTYGFDVAAEEAFPALVGERLAARFPDERVEVANFGWISSSPLLSLRRLRAIGDAYRPDIVVLCVDMTDFEDEIRWRNMLARRGIYRLYDKLPLALRTFQLLLPERFHALHRASLGDPPAQRFFALEQPLERSRPHLAPFEQSLVELRAHCAERGWRFTVFVLPRAHQYSERESPRNWEEERYTRLGPHCLEPFRYLEQLAGEVDLPVHSLLDAFRASEEFPLYFEADPHWNAAGHRVAAAAIARALEVDVEAVR